MATCVTKQQWAEAYNTEKQRLYTMESEGFDIGDAMSDLESMNKSYQAGKFNEAKKTAKLNSKKFTSLTTTDIAKVNKNKPRTAKGTKLRVLSGHKDDKGRVTYQVTYPNRKKVYDMSDARVYLDQMDSKYGVVFGNEIDSVSDRVTEYHEEFKEEIWNDQEAALRLFDELAAVDGVQNTEHMSELRELLENMTEPTKQVMNKFKVYLNNEAEKNNGVAVPYGNDPRIIINYSTSNTTNGDMSAAEVYVHEMVHMSVEVAKDFEKGAVASEIAELNRLYELAANKVTVEDLVENGNTARAERMWNYMFSNEESGMSEFLAYAMTNEKLKAKLKTISAKKAKEDLATKTLWDKVVFGVVTLFNTIRDVVMAKSDQDMADDRLGKLVTELWAHNNQTIENATIGAKIRQGAEVVTDIADKTLIEGAKQAAKLSGKLLNMSIDATRDVKVLGVPVGLVPKAIRTLVLTLNPWANEDQIVMLAEAFRIFEKGLGKFGGSLFAQEGSFARVVNYVKKDDEDIIVVEKLGLLAQNIDQMRENTIEQAGRTILEGLGLPDHKDQTALTKTLLELDTRVLNGDYTIEEIGEILGSDKKLGAEIDTLTGHLASLESDTSILNYYKSQTKGLGTYMATGRSGSSLNLNAKDIANMDYTVYWRDPASAKNKEFKKNEAEIIRIIDKLATLEGIKNTSADARYRTEQMIKQRPNGVRAVMEYHELQHLNERTYKEGLGINHKEVKGEIKDLQAPYVQSKMAPSDEKTKKAMRKKNFKYVGPSHVKGIGMYKRMTSGVDTFDKGAVAKINESKRMHNIVGITNEHEEDAKMGEKGFEAVDLIQIEADREVERQMKEGNEPILDGYIPLVDYADKVSNFGISVDSEMYADSMIQDKKAPVLLGKMIAETKEKTMARMQNTNVMNMIMKDMKDNYSRDSEIGKKNRREYIEIGPDAKFHSKDTVEAEFSNRLLRDMPENMKNQIKAKPKGQQYIAVRRDLATDIFGRRAPSILNAKIRLVSDKTLGEAFNENGLESVNEGIRLAGDIWQEVISVIKTDIVIKTPKVVIDNIMSNFNYSWALGQVPWETAKGQYDMFKATKSYVDKEKRKIRLQLEMSKGDRSKKTRDELRRIRNELKESPVHPLMEAGLFTAIIEDLQMRDLKTDTRFGAMFDKYTQKVPSIVRDATSTLYVTQDSQMFSALMQATVYADFTARANRYHFLLKKGFAPNQAKKMILDEFTNYNRDLGGALSWLKKLGFSQFHQYFFGSNKNMAEKMKSHPSAMVMMNVMLDAPHPGDAMIGTRDLSVNMHTPIDIITDQMPRHVLPPSMFEYVGLL